MPVQPGTRLGPYEIDSVIGAGGMGEVYRARDTRLKREVAIKVLPAAFVHDAERLARFEREAEVLATLNHPNIAAVYGFEETPDASGIVLELVDGPTLEDRLAHGPLPIEEALSIARQVADALGAAHEKGVIHRDLKPANIKLTPAGTVKVLDFGLAKVLDEVTRGAGGGPSGSDPALLSMSPTMAMPVTTGGLILGTAGYMSPEQARGKPVDRRADIWSFGCVLFEMLTGRRTFERGETVSDAVAAILTQEPDWAALPPAVPEPIHRLLRRCLQKNPDRRLHHVGDAQLEIADALVAPVAAAVLPAPRARRGAASMRLLPWGVAAVALGVAVFSWTNRTGAERSTGAPIRLELALPPGVELFTSSRAIAVSPDGTRIAFIGVRAGTRQVYVRSLDQFEAVPLRGSDSATVVFFAPDSRTLGVISNVGIMTAISLDDGLLSTVTDGAAFLYGADWGDNDQIVFVRDGALWRISRGGGEATRLTNPADTPGDTLHAHPRFLPGGRALVFAAYSGDRQRIESLTLETGERRLVVDNGGLPLHAASGHLVFVRDGELLAAPFDTSRLAFTGSPSRVIEGLPVQLQGMPSLDISASGTIVYAPTTAVSRLVTVSRQGAEQMLNDSPRSYANPRLAPDSNRLLVQAGDLWVQDLSRSDFTRLTPRDVVINSFPVWLPDGRTVMYRSPSGLRVQDAEGSSPGQVVAGTSDYDYPGGVAPDGDTLLFMRSTQETSFDIMALSLRNPAEVRAILQTPAYEGGVRISPDGKWMAYVSNESGRNDVYLRPFPALDRRWAISTQGGTQPVWNPRGGEIFYRDGDKMMAVDVTTSPEVRLSSPRLLFEQRYAYGAGITIANYDVTGDGQRFIMVKDETGASRLNVVLNWFTELQRLRPTSP